MFSLRSRKTVLALSAALGVLFAAALALLVPSTSRTSAVVTLPLLPIDRPAISSISALDNATGLDPSIAIGASTLGDLARSQDADSANVPASLRVGTSELSRGRILLDHLGRSGRWSIYAYPTTAGHVCYGLTGIGAGCIPGFLRGFPVSFNIVKPDLKPTGAGEAMVVYGLAPDDVTSVQVDTTNSTYQTKIANNAYFVQLDDNALSSSDVKQLVVVFHDGSTATIANDWPGRTIK